MIYTRSSYGASCCESRWRCSTRMPLYMDIHRNIDGNATSVAKARERDREIQDEHGVNHLKYWIDEDEGVAFCLFEAPSKAAGEAVHRAANNSIAEEIFQVEEGE